MKFLFMETKIFIDIMKREAQVTMRHRNHRALSKQTKNQRVKLQVISFKVGRKSRGQSIIPGRIIEMQCLSIFF